MVLRGVSEEFLHLWVNDVKALLFVMSNSLEKIHLSSEMLSLLLDLSRARVVHSVINNCQRVRYSGTNFISIQVRCAAF